MLPLYFLVLFALIGVFIPAYAQNVSGDEEEQRIKELIAACEKAIDEDDSMTVAQKTVAKRNCTSEVENANSDFDNDHQKAAERKAKLETIEKCEQWYPQYLILTEENFRINKGTEAVGICLTLYKDPIWEYEGKDRVDVLIDSLDSLQTKDEKIEEESEIITIEEEEVEIEEIAEKEIESTSNISEQDRITELEEQVKQLEEQITKKDEVIMEQLKVIMDLANRIKDVLFRSLGSLLFQI